MTLTLPSAVRGAGLELWTLPNLLRKIQPSPEEISRHVTNLKTSGYSSLERMLSEDALSTVQRQIDEAINRTNGYWNAPREYWALDESLCIAGLLDIATEETVVSIVNAYLGRSCFLADSDLRRIPPRGMKDIEKHGTGSSHWHRDTRGRQLKLMVYLTDVTERDSNFAFYPASHTQRQYGFAGSRFSDQETEALGTPIEWYGTAGDGMLFDTNLVHRLRRKKAGAVRDSVTFYYTPGQSLRRLSTATLSLDARQTRLVHGAPWWSKRV